MLFKKRKGFVLISTMLIVLMLSVIASEMSKAFFLDIRKEGYLSFDAIAHTKRIESEKFLLNFIKRELNKNTNVNKQNPIFNEDLIFQFDDFILQGSLTDYSNCFNVNHLITFKAGKSKDNLKAIKYFEDLLTNYEINYLDAEQIIDQILDWMDVMMSQGITEQKIIFMQVRFIILENTPLKDYLLINLNCLPYQV